MNKKHAKGISTFAAIILFLVPLSLKAQTTMIGNGDEELTQFSKEELAQMLAPIALYPDALLSQILIAASYPFEVAEAERWISFNRDLDNATLDQALSHKDWDVSILSLCHYPKVLRMMNDNLKWTAKLGDAFVNQKQGVMDTIQELRARASSQGYLVTTDEQKVIVEQRIIRVEPAYSDYLCVPVYDPLQIYGPWWYPAFPPFRIFYPGVAVIGPGIVYAPRLFIGFGVIGWSFFDWHTHRVWIVNLDRTRRFYKHAHVLHRPGHYHWKPDYKKREMPPLPKRENLFIHHPRVNSPRTVPEGGFKKDTVGIVSPKNKTDNRKTGAIGKSERPFIAPKQAGKHGATEVVGPRVNDKDKSQRQFKYPFKKQQLQLKVQPIPSPLSVVNKGSLTLQSSGSPKVLKNSLCQLSFRATGVVPIVT